MEEYDESKMSSLTHDYGYMYVHHLIIQVVAYATFRDKRTHQNIGKKSRRIKIL